eukprot:c17686_g1_i1 orf=1-870(-)
MAIRLPRKTLSSWSFKWLQTSPLVPSYTAYLDVFRTQHECRDDAYVKMARCIVKDAPHPTAHFRGECLCMKMVGLTKTTPNYGFLSSHAMAQMPLCKSRGSYFSNHIRMQSTEAVATTQCWSCGKPKSEKDCLICLSCNVVQAIDPAVTYFQIFNQEQQFELDLKDLEAKYKSLMKRLHPDLSHGKSTEEKKNYAQLSALVTTAYTELLNPVSRATYLLKLRGIHVEQEGTVNDSELIMEVMEMRETLQSLPDRKTLEQLYNMAMSRMDQWSKAFNTALKEGNDTAAVGA